MSAHVIAKFIFTMFFQQLKILFVKFVTIHAKIVTQKGPQHVQIAVLLIIENFSLLNNVVAVPGGTMTEVFNFVLNVT